MKIDEDEARLRVAIAYAQKANCADNFSALFDGAFENKTTEAGGIKYRELSVVDRAVNKLISEGIVDGVVKVRQQIPDNE